MFRYTPLFSRVFLTPRVVDVRNVRNIGPTRSLMAKCNGKASVESTCNALGKKVRVSGGSIGRRTKVSAAFLCGSLVTLHHLLGSTASCASSSGDGPLDPIVKKVKEVINTLIIPWVNEHGFSGVLGFFSGVAIKKIGKSVASAIGLVILAAQVTVQVYNILIGRQLNLIYSYCFK
jgi:hypothetical protein